MEAKVGPDFWREQSGERRNRGTCFTAAPRSVEISLGNLEHDAGPQQPISSAIAGRGGLNRLARSCGVCENMPAPANELLETGPKPKSMLKLDQRARGSTKQSTKPRIGRPELKTEDRKSRDAIS